MGELLGGVTTKIGKSDSYSVSVSTESWVISVSSIPYTTAAPLLITQSPPDGFDLPFCSDFGSSPITYGSSGISRSHCTLEFTI